MKVPGTFGSIIPWWLLIVIGLVILGFVVSLSGCASADFDYHWMKTRDAAPKPWLTVEVTDTDFVCRSLGADPSHQLSRINGCADWNQIRGCTIYAPKNAPQWLLEHERKHCEGWTH